MHRARPVLRRWIALPLALSMALAGLGLTSSAALGSPSDGHVTGVVTGPGGAPIANVWVNVAYLNYGTWLLAASALTRFDGRYDLDVPEGGPHRMVFSHAGYATEYYDNATTMATATNVPVTSGVTTVADAELAVAGHVTGTVTGTGGIGVPEVDISAWQLVGTDWVRTGATAYTDDQGDYDLDGLPTGDFRLKLERPYGSDYISEWWDDARTVETATTVSVMGGAITSGKDAELSAEGPRPVVSNTALPAISGTARVGTTVTATPGTWTPAGTTPAYQWLVAGSPVTGASTASYTPIAADAGKSLQVRVTATAAGHTTGTATSDALTIAKGALKATRKPKVTGKTKKGATLRVSPGTWSPARVTVTYRWYAGAKAIPKATTARLELAGKTVRTVAGRAISVRVTVTAPGYDTVTTSLRVPGRLRR